MNVIVPQKTWLAIEPIDMRIGIDGLATRVQQSLARSACDGAAYVFRNRRNSRIKVLVWDSTGVWCCQRRLHQGCFVWPTHVGDSVNTKTFELTTAQWNWLITGIDWQRLTPQQTPQWSF
jgi:transposase